MLYIVIHRRYSIPWLNTVNNKCNDNNNNKGCLTYNVQRYNDTMNVTMGSKQFEGWEIQKILLIEKCCSISCIYLLFFFFLFRTISTHVLCCLDAQALGYWGVGTISCWMTQNTNGFEIVLYKVAYIQHTIHFCLSKANTDLKMVNEKICQNNFQCCFFFFWKIFTLYEM